VADDDEVAAVGDGGDHRVGIVLKLQLVVVAGQVGGVDGYVIP
jgi:hypothetical protein